MCAWFSPFLLRCICSVVTARNTLIIANIITGVQGNTIAYLKQRLFWHKGFPGVSVRFSLNMGWKGISENKFVWHPYL